MNDYWIVCCRPKYFKKECGFNGEKIPESGWRWFLNYDGHDRKHKDCFQAMKKGDQVLCYVSSDKDEGTDKIHAFMAVLSVCQKDEKSVFLHFENSINISSKDISKEIIELYPNENQYSAFTKKQLGEVGNNWFNGTFFKTNKEQFEAILQLAK